MDNHHHSERTAYLQTSQGKIKVVFCPVCEVILEKNGVKMEIKLYICKFCFRELPEDRMKKNMAQAVSEQCSACFDIMGGKRGFGGEASKSDEEWFEGCKERKAKLIEEGKLNA